MNGDVALLAFFAKMKSSEYGIVFKLPGYKTVNCDLKVKSFSERVFFENGNLGLVSAC